MKPSQLILLLLLGTLLGILYLFSTTNQIDEFNEYREYREFPFNFPRLRLNDHSKANEIPHVIWPPYVDIDGEKNGKQNGKQNKNQKKMYQSQGFSPYINPTLDNDNKIQNTFIDYELSF